MKNLLILFFALAELTSCCTRKSAEGRIIDFSDFERLNESAVYELSDGTDRLVIQNVPIGTEIYITKTNTSDKVIPKESAIYVLEAEGISLNVKNPKEEFEKTQSRQSLTTPSSGFGPHKIFRKTEKLNSYDAHKESNKKKSKVIIQKEYDEGRRKDIFVDINSDMTIYEKKSATLASKGKFCYVWTVDGDGSPEKIMKASQKMSVAFDAMYEKIRFLFGKESDFMFCNYNGKFFEPKRLEYMSGTGTKVNIVVYDINRENNGVVGYFYSKDYFPSENDYENGILNYSNEGKYIYIDSQWAEADIDVCISTLAHEFQHMISYNQKVLIHDLPDADAFSEMMSLLCEEIINEDEENANLNSRLALFNSGYAECGLEYRGCSHYHAMLSYAANYAFGTWLYRNYGGTALIRKLATNQYTDINSITNATGKSMQQLLKAYSIDCACRTKSSSYLWSLHKSDYDDYGYKYDGPVFYAFNARHEIRPYGMFIIKAGKTDSDTLMFKFSKKNFQSHEHTYIVANFPQK